MSSVHDAHYRAMIEHAPSLIWRAGPAGERDYFNTTWLTFTGRSQREELGMGWVAGVQPEDLGAYIATQQAHFARREPFEIEYRLRRHDGAYRWLLERVAPYADAAGAFAGFVGNCVEVADRSARDASFGVNEFFDMSLDNLCVAGFDGYFKRLNPSWTRTLGWTAEELMAEPSEQFVHPEDRAATLSGRKRLHDGSSLGPHVNRYRCKDGTYRWFEWRSVAHLDRGLVYAAARDITEQKLAAERLSEAKAAQERLQRQLVFADRMASVGTLAAGVAHEINNPLAYVMGNLSLMSEALSAIGPELPAQRAAEMTELLLDAQNGAERIRKIVRGLKTFSRAEEERHAVVDVQRLLDLSVSMTSNELRHRARLVKDYGAVPLVEADEARLGQVFVNLLINAAQALPEGDLAANEVRIATSTDALGRAVIEVRDTGVGIAPHLIGRVFDPFFTTKPIGIGTGLGLSICHNIVTAMGGEISVASELGRGTTLRVELPAAMLLQDHGAAPAAVEASARVSGSVLVVDDEPGIGSMLGRLLQEHAVTIVPTALRALELISAGKRFDVILSDLMMPEMSGMDFYDELVRRAPHLAKRVVFVSGGAFTPVARAFLDRVPNERMDKPIDAPGLRALVQRFVRDANPADSRTASAL